MEPNESCQETAAQFSLVASLYNSGDLHDVMFLFVCTMCFYIMKTILKIETKVCFGGCNIAWQHTKQSRLLFLATNLPLMMRFG